MKKMFRTKFLLATTLLAAGLLFTTMSCSHDGDEDKEPSGATMYTVTFDSKGGSAVAPQSVESGKTASKPANAPTKSGVTFGGWYKDEEPFSFSTKITSNITLTAKWISEQYTKSGVTLAFYDDGTFEYKETSGTSRGTYKKDGGKIEATFTDGNKSGDIEVDTSGDTPTVKENGTEVDGFEQVKEPTNQNTQTGETYEVGTTVTVDGVKYLVIKNTETPLLTVTKSPAHHYYPNAKADAYRETLIAKYNISEPYVILFNTETVKPDPITTSYWDDEYRILCDGKAHLKIKHRWSRGSEKIDQTIFETVSADYLRQNYDPTGFIVENYNANYGTDLSKKILNNYNFNYDEPKGKTATYVDDKIVQTSDYKDFVYVANNQKERNQWLFDEYDITEKRQQYGLRNPYNANSGTFFKFNVYYADEDDVRYTGGEYKTIRANKPYTLVALTKGTVSDDTTDKNYQNTLTIRTFYYDSEGEHVNFEVQPKVNNENIQESYERFGGLTERETEDEVTEKTEGHSVSVRATYVENKGVGKYVTVSGTTKELNKIEVPEWITFSVPFAYEGAELNDFSKVTFVPQAEGADTVIYVPKEGEDTPYDFIDKFKKGYDIFGEWSLTRS